MNDYRKAAKRVDVSVGDSVRILRELQEMSQNDLAAATGIPQSTISAIENNRVRLGVDRTKVLARALQCHPAVVIPRKTIAVDGGETRNGRSAFAVSDRFSEIFW